MNPSVKALFLCCLLAAGCKTASYDGIISSEPFPPGRMIVASPERIQEEFDRRYDPAFPVLGFFDRRRDEYWVPPSRDYDVDGLVIPDLEVLGHEHLHHVRGYWHR